MTLSPIAQEVAAAFAAVHLRDLDDFPLYNDLALSVGKVLAPGHEEDFAEACCPAIPADL